MLLDFRPDGICVICVICETFLYICDNLRICVSAYLRNLRETFFQNNLRETI